MPLTHDIGVRIPYPLLRRTTSVVRFFVSVAVSVSVASGRLHRPLGTAEKRDQSEIPVGIEKSYAKIVAKRNIKKGISATPRN